MEDSNQGAAAADAPETEISADLSEADPTRAVTRRRSPPSDDIASQTRDNARGSMKRTPFERELFKRMSRLERNFDQKMAVQNAENQRQISALREENERLRLERNGGGASTDSDHDRAMAALQEKLAAANERGDSAEAAKITGEMARAEGAYHAKLAGTAVRRDAGGADPNAGAARQAGAAGNAPVAPTGPTPAGARFITANEDWWEDPDCEIEKSAASQIYLKLVNEEGFSNNSDDTFDEVAARLRQKFPRLDVRAASRRARSEPGLEDDGGDREDRRQADDDDGQHRNPRRAVAPSFQDRGGADDNRSGRNRRTLTGQDIKTMRAVGMDPSNNDHVLRFLREQQSLEA